jgi:hypothetical protein
MPNDSSAPVTQAILDTTLQKHLSAMQSELIGYVDLKHEQRIHAVEATLELAA